jgi:hypothetical protein
MSKPPMKRLPLRAPEAAELQRTERVLVVRPISEPLTDIPDDHATRDEWQGDRWIQVVIAPDGASLGSRSRRCPLGSVGERRWVAEGWHRTHREWTLPGEYVKSSEECQRDNDGYTPLCGDGIVYQADGVTEHPTLGAARWFSAARMPRWASRATATCAELKVERIDGVWHWCATFTLDTTEKEAANV